MSGLLAVDQEVCRELSSSPYKATTKNKSWAPFSTQFSRPLGVICVQRRGWTRQGNPLGASPKAFDATLQSFIAERGTRSHEIFLGGGRRREVCARSYF